MYVDINVNKWISPTLKKACKNGGFVKIIILIHRIINRDALFIHK